MTGRNQQDEKPTPSIPPTDRIIHPEENRGTSVLESEAVDTCDCGGTIYDEQIATGKTIIAMWDATEFDSETYKLSEQYPQTENRVRCDRCSTGWTY